MPHDNIHTCSYSCERPACIRAQRDELAQRLLELVAEAVAAEKELIAQWVESWGNDLTIKEIVEGIRTNGNGAIRPIKYVTRDSGEG